MPPPHGTVAEARAYSGGSTSGSGPAGGASTGGNYSGGGGIGLLGGLL